MALGGMEDEIPRSGADLFKELLRIFPLAKAEDYYRDGRWLVKQLEVDTELVRVHRVEAGAPEPPPLAELDMPSLPVERAPPRAAPPGRPTSVPSRPTSVPAGGRGPPPKSSPRPRTPPRDRRPRARSEERVLRPVPPKEPPTASNYRSGGSAGAPPAFSASSLVQQTNDFIQRWKLSMYKTKALLLKLPMDLRKEVIANFKPVDKKQEPMAELERYIEEHVERNHVKPTAKKPIGSKNEERPEKRQRVSSAGPSPAPSPSSARPSASSLPSKQTPPAAQPSKNFSSNSFAKSNGKHVSSESAQSVGKTTSSGSRPPHGKQAGSAAGSANGHSVLPATTGKYEPGDLIKSLLGN